MAIFIVLYPPPPPRYNTQWINIICLFYYLLIDLFNLRPSLANMICYDVGKSAYHAQCVTMVCINIHIFNMFNIVLPLTFYNRLITHDTTIALIFVHQGKKYLNDIFYFIINLCIDNYSQLITFYEVQFLTFCKVIEQDWPKYHYQP